MTQPAARLVLLFLTCALLALAPGARAQDGAPPAPADPGPTRTGTLAVRLKMQTQGSTARLGDIEVRVLAFDARQRVAEQVGMTADGGEAALTGLAVTDARQFVVSALFQGVIYASHGLSFPAGGDRLEVEIPVYESTGDHGALSIEQLHLVVTPSKTGGSLVSEVMTLSNSGDRTVLGDRDSGVTLTLDVPEGIRDLQVVEGILERYVLQGTGAIAITAPIHPGKTQTVIQYEVPTAQGWFFRRRFPVPAQQISVFTPVDGPAILSRQLTQGEPLTLEGGTFNRYTADASAGREGLTFQVDGGATVATTGPSVATGGPAVFAVGILAVLGTLVLLLRPLLVKAPPALVSAGRYVTREEARRIELERSKERRLDAVDEIDFDFQTGKIAPDDYEVLRRQYKAEAIEVIQQLRSLDGGADAAPAGPAAPAAPAPAPAARADADAPAGIGATCPTCGASARAGDRFCGQCGAPLAAAATG